MRHINLLPWREERREQQKKMFSAMLVGGIGSAVLITLAANYYVDGLISNQNRRNTILETEIKIFDVQISEIKALKEVREALIARMMVVQNLQSTRALTVHLFDELIKIMPDGVYLTSLERKEKVITLLGYAESNTNISMLLRNIVSNPWIKNPVLTEIKKDSKSKLDVPNQFKLSFILEPEQIQGAN